RQLDADHGYDPASPNNKNPEPNFKLDFVYNTDLASKDFKYGALARDGVSCAACHHIVRDHTPPGQDPLQWFLNHKIQASSRAAKWARYSARSKTTVSRHPQRKPIRFLRIR